MSINRRMFLGGLAALVGGLAVEEAIPLGRVWSFPTEIVIPKVAGATMESYADYMNISDLMLTPPFDEIICDMQRRLNQTINAMIDHELGTYTLVRKGKAKLQ